MPHLRTHFEQVPIDVVKKVVQTDDAGLILAVKSSNNHASHPQPPVRAKKAKGERKS